MQYANHGKLFDGAAEGKKELFTSTIVVFEIYWLFKSFYKKTKSEVIDILKKTLKLNFIKIEERKTITKAIEIYEGTTLELEDCYNIVYSTEVGAKEFLTFDRKLNTFLKRSNHQ